MSDEGPLIFAIKTPLEFCVHVTRARWEQIISIKHPVMSGREASVRAVLEWPDAVRLSRSDRTVYMFYAFERPGRWICAVVKRLNGEGFLITAYPTDAIKEGIEIWHR